MKIAINNIVKDGPWGGGNSFVRALIEGVSAKGDEVTHALDDPDIDIILIADPRRRNPSTTFSPGHILRYLTFRNPGAIVIHRINECDERKNTRTMNARLRLANYCADHTVFVGSWLRDLDLWRSGDGNGSSIILNGANRVIFNAQGFTPWDGASALKLVTHHWGGNWMKGFDVYQKLDQMLGTEEWRNKIEFTYIGNLPSGFSFKNATYLQPLSGEALADELRQHHVYLTASINEPGGNHQNEGALCGLPLIYRDSGCMPEYCAGYGAMFADENDFVPALNKMMENYAPMALQMASYPHTSEKTISEYMALFESLIMSRDEIIQRRNLWRNPLCWFANQIPV